MMGKEDDPFLLGFGNFSGVNSLLNFGGIPTTNPKRGFDLLIGCDLEDSGTL